MPSCCRRATCFTGCLVLLLLFGTLLEILVLTGNWCRRSKSQLKEGCDLLAQTAAVLAKGRGRVPPVAAWLCYGSALAAYRDGGRPIPWETDDDLCIMGGDAEAAHAALEGAGLTVSPLDLSNVVAFRILKERAGSSKRTRRRRYHPHHHGQQQQQPSHKPSLLPSSLPPPALKDTGCSTCSYWIDVYAYEARNHSHWGPAITMIESTSRGAKKSRSLPLKVLRPLRSVAYCGVPASAGLFKVPGRVQEYLGHVFGVGYMTPSFSTPSNGYRRVTCALWNA